MTLTPKATKTNPPRANSTSMHSRILLLILTYTNELQKKKTLQPFEIVIFKRLKKKINEKTRQNIPKVTVTFELVMQVGSTLRFRI